MTRKTLALLLALAAGSAYAAADSFADSIPAQADGVPLAYVGKDTTATTALTLTAKPSGGDAIGYLPKDSRVHVLLADDHGNHLVRTDYGLTGWAQKGENPDAGSEAFPPLETAKDEYAATLHYNPQLAGKPHNNPSEETLTLETALQPGGVRYQIYCDGDVNTPPCTFTPIAKKQAKKATRIGLPDNLTLPGNGYVYSNSSDNSPYRLRDKWRIQGKEAQNIKQPFYALGYHGTYQGRSYRQENGLAETRAEPLPLTDRIDGSNTIAEVAPGSEVTLILLRQPFARAGEAPDYSYIAKDSPYWLLLQTADGKTGWHKVESRFNADYHQPKFHMQYD